MFVDKNASPIKKLFLTTILVLAIMRAIQLKFFPSEKNLNIPSYDYGELYFNSIKVNNQAFLDSIIDKNTFDLALEKKKNEILKEIYGEIQSMKIKSAYEEETKMHLLYEAIHTHDTLYYDLVFDFFEDRYKMLYAVAFTTYQPKTKLTEIGNRALKFMRTGNTEVVSDSLSKNIGAFPKEWKSFLKNKHLPFLKKYPKLYKEGDKRNFQLAQLYFGDILREENLSSYFNLNSEPIIAMVYETKTNTSSYAGNITIYMIKKDEEYQPITFLQFYNLPLIVPRTFVINKIPLVKHDQFLEAMLALEDASKRGDIPPSIWTGSTKETYSPE